MESFVPTEYSNAYIDNEGFIYSVLKTFSQWDLRSDKAKPIRRLNALGNDILIKNAEYPPIGDLEWSNAAGIKGSSKFVDVTVLDNEVYLALDETRGRIFAYNNQGYLLFAFGGRGNVDGFFRKPSSLEHIGKDHVHPARHGDMKDPEDLSENKQQNRIHCDHGPITTAEKRDQDHAFIQCIPQITV